jgi:hypothetical protein
MDAVTSGLIFKSLNSVQKLGDRPAKQRYPIASNMIRIAPAHAACPLSWLYPGFAVSKLFGAACGVFPIFVDFNAALEGAETPRDPEMIGSVERSPI